MRRECAVTTRRGRGAADGAGDMLNRMHLGVGVPAMHSLKPGLVAGASSCERAVRLSSGG